MCQEGCPEANPRTLILLAKELRGNIRTARATGRRKGRPQGWWHRPGQVSYAAIGITSKRWESTPESFYTNTCNIIFKTHSNPLKKLPSSASAHRGGARVSERLSNWLQTTQLLSGGEMGVETGFTPESDPHAPAFHRGALQGGCHLWPGQQEGTGALGGRF